MPTRISHLVAFALLATLIAGASLIAPGIAAAQPRELPQGGPPGQAMVIDQNGQRIDVKVETKAPTNSKAVALLFWLFAAACIGGALFVITRRNLIAAVMGMVGTFFAVAAVYAMLYAHFLAIIQILVYAGAIMVLFVFVIMILNRPEDEPWGLVGVPGKALAGGAMLYLLYRLIAVLWSVQPVPGRSLAPGATLDGADWGSTKAVGNVLFTDYLFPFEAISILLLIAVVGAIAIAHPHHKEDDEPQEPQESGT